MFGIGAPEFILIIVIGLIVFGPGKLPELARSIGKGMREFKKATNALTQALNAPDAPVQQATTQQPATATPAPQATAQQPVNVATQPAQPVQTATVAAAATQSAAPAQPSTPVVNPNIAPETATAAPQQASSAQSVEAQPVEVESVEAAPVQQVPINTAPPIAPEYQAPTQESVQAAIAAHQQKNA